MRRPVRPGCVRHATLPFLVSLALTLLAAAAPSAPRPKPPGPGGAGGPEYVEGEILVKLRPDAAPAARRALRTEVAGAVQTRFASGAERWRLGAGVSVPEAVARLKGDPEVEYAEPNYIVHTTRTPDDPLFTFQYDLLNNGQGGGVAGADIDATEAWDISIGLPSIVVAVVDTGIDYGHPDLAANLWTNPGEIPGNLIDDDGNGQIDDIHGWDFVNHDDDPFDDMGHGTHVAGTIAAATDNGIGIAGIAWNTRLMPVKFLDRFGAGNTGDAIAAIDYAARSGARIMNASWGGGGFSLAMQEAIRDAGAHEVLFVAAAGNAGENNDIVPFFPAGYDAPNIIAVAATDRRDQLARFSNRGATTVDIAAPGVDIMSTLPGGIYGFNSGTSMATPHVSGVAALVLGFAPGMGAVPLRQRLIEHAEPLAGLQGQVASGGRVNAFLCLQGADTVPPGPIADLRVVEPLSNGLVLAWTATGDDGDGGAAVGYDLRISETPFGAVGFDAVPRVPFPGAPLPAGSGETREVGGLEPSRTYYIGLRAVDEWGNAGLPDFATAGTRPPPVMEVSPDSSSAALKSGESATRVLTLRNTGQGTLDWRATRPQLRSSVAHGPVGTDRFGGPDGFGYVFTDSDDADGPVFAWRDILATGRSALVAGDDVISASIPIGFDFPFYGKTFSSLRIAGNGFLSFTHPDSPYENQPLPSPGAPGNLVAGFWDDLYVGGLQNVVWLAEPHAFTVQYDNVVRYGGGGPYTFQIVLFDTGEILFQYLSMAEPLDSATIGIQDATGIDGLPIAFNTASVHDGLAIRVFLQKPWLSAAPGSGRLGPGESAPITLTFDASGLAAGTYEATLPILGNDPDRPRVEHPVSLTVEDAAAIGVEPAAVDFGRVFAGYGARRTVAVASLGSLPLTVSAAVPEDAAVVSDFAPFVLAPGERRFVNLDWQPASPGGLQSALRIESDAANAPSLSLPLAGTAVGPPRLTVDPPEVDESVPLGGSSERVLTLGNEGPSDLDYQVTIGQPADLTKGAIEIFPPSPQALTCVVADPAAGMLYGQARRRNEFYRLRLADQTWETLPASPLSSGINCGAALLRGQIYTASGDRLGVYNIASNFWYTIASPLGVATSNIASDGDRWIYLALGASVKRFDPSVAGSEQSLPAPPFSFDRWGGFQVDRGILYAHAGNGATWFVRYDPFVSVWTVLPSLPLGGTAGAAIDPVSGDYFAAGPSGGSSLYHYDAKNSAWSLSPLPFPVEDGGLAWLGLPVGAIYFVEGERGDRIGRMLLADARTAGLDIASGRIAPGGSAAVRVRFDAAGLPGGSYESDLTIRSNDPAAPERVVPVRLTVEGGASLRIRGEPAFLRSTLTFATQGAATRHDLQLPSTPRGPGTLRLVAEGDFGGSDEIARVSIEGQQIGSAGATGLDCSAAEGFFSLTSTQMEGLAIDGIVSVTVANSVGVEAFCERSRHTVELSYRGAGDLLDFGQRFVGNPLTLRLEIENAGNGSLTFSSTTGAPEFIVPPGPWTLAPGERMLLPVEYRPFQEGLSVSTLLLASNDPVSPTIVVPLQGSAHRPSEGVISPLSFAETLDRGLTVTRPLQIENHGGVPLSFSFVPRLVSGASCAPTEALLLESQAGILSRVDLAGIGSSRVAYVPGPGAGLALGSGGTAAFVSHGSGGSLVRVELATGVEQALGPSFSTAGGIAATADTVFVSQTGTGFVFAVPVAGGAPIVAVPGLDQPVDLALTADRSTLYAIERGKDRLVRIPLPGGLPQAVASGLGWVGGLVLDEAAGRALVSFPASGTIASIHLVTGAVTTLASGLEGPTSIALLAVDDLLVVEDSPHRLTRLNLASGDRRTVLAGIATPAALAPLPTQACSQSFVRVEPAIGLVEPGGLRTLAVTFDASELPGGTYAADIAVATNDPAAPNLVIPASLTVTGGPDWDVAVEDAPLTSEATFSGSGATTSHLFPLPDPRPLAGEIELEVTGNFAGLSQYARAVTSLGTAVQVGGTGLPCGPFSLRRDLGDFVLNPPAGSEASVSVQNSAATAGSTCGVDRHRVTLHLYRSADHLDVGGQLSRSLTKRDLLVINRGAGLLTVSSVSSDNPAARVTPSSFQVPGRGRRHVTVTIEAPASGPDAGVIDLQSDDPDRPHWSIPWSVEAREAPVLSVDSTTIVADLGNNEERTIPVVVTNTGGLDLVYAVSLQPFGADWISFAPMTGVVTLPPGESRVHTLTLRSTNRAPGTLLGTIELNSNDPQRPTTRVNVVMTIHGIPRLFLEKVTSLLSSTKTFYREGEEVEHAFTVAPGAQSANITATVTGDFDGLTETSQLKLEGTGLTTVDGAATVCGSKSKTVTVLPSQLLQFSADGLLRFTMKNSAAVQPHCPVNRQQLDVTLVSAATAVEFGSVRVGDGATRFVSVKNVGLESLRLQSVSASGPFGIAVGFPTLMSPGGSVSVPLSFQPATAGDVTGTLVIESTDPVTPVVTLPIRGRGIGPPSVRIEPGAFDQDVALGGVATLQATLYNDGPAPLSFRIGQRATPAPLGGVVPPRFDELPSSPVPLSGVAGDPESGAVYAIEYTGSRFFRLAAGASGWQELSQSPLATSGSGGAGAALLKGKIYLALGREQIPCYDIAAGTWSFVPTPVGIVGRVITTDSERWLYLASGSMFLRLDPASGETQAMAPFPVGMDGQGGMAYADGAIYAHRSLLPHLFGRYDLDGNNWTILQSPPTAPLLGAAFDASTGDYLTYGPNSGDNILRFTPQTSTWSVEKITDHNVTFGGIAWLPGTTPGAIVVQGMSGTKATRFDASPPLFRVVPGSGTVPAGGSLPLSILIDTGVRSADTYEDRFVVDVDDPARNLVVPVDVHARLDRDFDGVRDSDDNCPERANPGQEDGDTDGHGDVCDVCVNVPDPGQEDADQDGIGDACDGCTDSDADGFADAASAASTCPADNCPARANADQADADGDGVGNVCDPCDDADRDGFADRDGMERVCPLDNCPAVSNPDQADRDLDHLGDRCDPCPDDVRQDVDSDGLCADNCPLVANAAQEDADGDGFGDVCDVCPARADPVQADRDGDRVGDLCDDCPSAADPAQADADADGDGDVCDNCPATANPAQEDADADGSGDACQPTIVIDRVIEDGGDLLEVAVRIADPQSDPLSGRLALFAQGAVVDLQNVALTLSCDLGWLLDGNPGEGIGYYHEEGGLVALFDLDNGLGCGDGVQDYEIAPGTCAEPLGVFDSLFYLPGQALPFSLCIRRTGIATPGIDMTVRSWDANAVRLFNGSDAVLRSTPQASPIPRRIAVDGLMAGATYRLEIDATDGNTRPVTASVPFRYGGEQWLTLNVAPRAAAAWPQGTVECAGPSGSPVILDASPSSDDDSPPGGPSDIVLYEWFETGAGGTTLLGTGAQLATTLPLGTHAMALRVTDSLGATDRVESTVVVADTVAPTLTVSVTPTLLWPPNHRMVPVSVSWHATDACSGQAQVVLVGVSSSEPDDAPGNDDGRTRDDIADAQAGTADTSVQLRAERDFDGPGRVYTLRYVATDAAGHATPGQALVHVPTDDRKRVTRRR